MLSVESGEKPSESRANEAVTAAPASVPESLPRRFERFTLLARVARGGMGEVYLATAQGIEGAERPLVVKIVRPDHADDRSFVARFLDEARIQAQLSHPGVAQILEATTDTAGKPYVVVEYVEGRNLSDVRTRSGQLAVRISWPEAIALGVCLGEALAHVHERTDANGSPLDIVHRDLSPQNVMIGYGGEVKLIDFGTARGQNRRCQTVAGIVFAKPGYVAPEVANNEPGGIPADLYAFGVILWELLAGRRFLSGEATQHMAAVGAGKRTLPPLSRIVGCPVEMDALLSRLTATAVEERYPSARAATQDLVKLLQRAPSLADGDRSVRGRIADLMHRLYPAEPARSRADFAKRVAEARAVSAHKPKPTPEVPPPSPNPPQSADPSLLAGTRYRVVREIARGAMGVVHEAVHADLGRTVALKILEGEAMSAHAQSRFRAEARAIAAIEHENLVKIYDFGTCNDGRLYYAMELLDGESLEARISREKRLTEHAAVDLGIQVCHALEAAHGSGVIHRDIKPGNLFVTAAGTLKVLDFGIAKAGTEIAPVAMDGELYVLGTPEYMAPEQAQGAADARSDVYAIGVVLYELVTGQLPFDGEGPLAILSQKAARLPVRPSLRTVDAKVSAAFDRVLLRALDPDPLRRYPSVHALRLDLQVVALPVAPPPKRRAKRVGAVAVGLTLMGCVWVLGAAGAQNPAVRSTVDSFVTRWDERLDRYASRFSSQSPAGSDSAPVAPPAGELLPAKTAGVTLMPSAPGAEPPRPEPVEAVQTARQPAPDAAPEVASTQPQKLAPAAEAALAEAADLSRRGRDLRALEVLRRAAERHADQPAVLHAFASALAKNRSWGEAVRVARRGAELDSSPEARLELARLERATGHRERAVVLLKDLVEDERAGSEARELLRVLTGSDRIALKD